MPDAKPSDLLTTQAVARLKGCSVRTVQRAIRDGFLRAERVVGDSEDFPTLLVRRRDAEAWQGKRQVGRKKKS